MIWIHLALMALAGCATIAAGVQIDRARFWDDTAAEGKWRLVAVGFAICFGGFGLLISAPS